MRKSILALILLLVVFTSSMTLSAQEGLIIREIVVVGNTRTSERVIRGQLPFKEGDVWKDDFREWTIRRFTTLNIFAYEPMRIITEPLSDGECRVLVRIGDPSVLYKDPAEFAFTTGVGLIFSQFTPTIFNPLGTGQNLNLNIVWGHNYSYGGSVTSPLGPGTFALGGRYYRSDRVFSNTDYESSGWSLEGSYRYWWSDSLRQTTRIQYHSYELDSEKNDYISPSLGIYFSDMFSGSLSSTVGFSLRDEPFFWQVQGVLFGQYGPVIGLTRAGYTSDSTPVNHRFITGGFSMLPLRGENPWHLTKAYALGTVEYHLSLGDMLAPIVFIDGGWLWKSGSIPGIDALLINIGLGVAFYTPLGVPVRLDLAINPVTFSWGWNLGFGHTYSPPF
jgi:outer membrane protein assembly factor BamA